jgi:hypothetical protein
MNLLYEILKKQESYKKSFKEWDEADELLQKSNELDSAKKQKVLIIYILFYLK